MKRARNRKPNENYYWMMVTFDKYELPLIVADTVQELGELSGIKPKSIIEEISRAKRTGWKCIWKKVPREEFINLEEEINDRNM